MDDALERRFRRWLLEEASNTGPVAADATGPSVSANTWRYPIRRNTDKAYWEVDDCEGYLEPHHIPTAGGDPRP